MWLITPFIRDFINFDPVEAIYVERSCGIGYGIECKLTDGSMRPLLRNRKTQEEAMAALSELISFVTAWQPKKM